MLRTAFFILFIRFCILCQAQNDTISQLPGGQVNLKLSYNSSIIYPGISAGLEFPVLRSRNQFLIVRSATRSYFKNRYIAGNISWYHHAYFHDNVYLTFELIMRRTRSGGFVSELSFGPGYSRTFLAGTTYRVSDNGDISVIKNAGYNYAALTIGGGFGYNFSMKSHIPLSIFSKMNLLFMFPYNSTVYIRPALELGFRYSPGRANRLKRIDYSKIKKR